MRKCTCDSGEWGEEQYDARGIYLCITCSSCHVNKMKAYRPEVLTDSDYECNEEVDP